MREVINFINNLNISKDEYVVLACSYGPDSMCLLDLLCRCKLTVVVAHVNHKVRSESDEEYRLLEEYCKKSNIPFEGMSILGEINGNFESKAREIRYNFFEEILTKYNANNLFKTIIAVNHKQEYMFKEALTCLQRLAKIDNNSNCADYTRIGNVLAKIDINKAVQFYEDLKKEDFYNKYKTTFDKAYKELLLKKERGYKFKPRKK